MTRTLTCLATLLFTSSAFALVADFDDLPLAADSHWNARDEWLAAEMPSIYDAQFVSGGVTFDTQYAWDGQYESWTGVAYSNKTDAQTGGFDNQFSVYADGDHGGDGAFGVVFGYHESYENFFKPAFDPDNPAHLQALPTVTLPTGGVAQEVWVTNTTYAARAMLFGDLGEFMGEPVTGEPLGGVSGDEPDWFKLQVYGVTTAGERLQQVVEFYLADYRDPDSNNDYVVDEWTRLDLTPLSGAATLYFNMQSSEESSFGMTNPGYFALDDLRVSAGPLPGDYNGDFQVDAADYSAWRNALGDEVAAAGLGADGDLSGVVDTGDYDVWRLAYGDSLIVATPVAGAPEPAAVALLLLTLAGLRTRRYV